MFEGLGDGRGMIHGRDGDAADGHAGATAGGVSHGAGASGVYATDASVVEVKMHAFGVSRGGWVEREAWCGGVVGDVCDR